jgi:small nuclear ribonucleoprotein (snRNP)-like protein
MSDISAAKPIISWLMVAAGAISAAALVVLSINSAPVAPFKPAGAVGSIQAVSLTNGQLYFGTLKSTDAAEIILADVFDLATNVKPDSGEHATQLIRRVTGSVYGPADLAIPIDRILTTETVGQDSTVAKAMATMKSAPGAPK